LVESPFGLREELLRLIAREAEHARAGRRSRIIIKINALTDAEMIRALYSASRDGVEIALIVRGMCCLRPGVAGVSHNIRVRSIVGRFLEHGRVYYFYNAGDPALYLASADLMERNLSRRIEAAVPIESAALRRRVLQALALYLRDNREAWLLGADGRYRAARPRGRSIRRAQQMLLRRLSGEVVPANPADTTRAEPLRPDVRGL
ncbi:MAG: polyphosphate kinase 1, partial [Gammaproteobacteria bacterium]